MPLDIQKIRELRPQNTFHYFRTTGSTMTEACYLASLEADPGTVVIADEQISGIGRLGRSWISELDVGIYCSILLKLPLPASRLPVASLLAGLATAEAIEKCTHLACDLRWPNDVLIGERKVAGILTQLVENYVVAGIGINVNNTAFPPGLRTPATSLLLSSAGRRQSRENLVVYLTDSLDTFSSLLRDGGPDAILRSFAAASSYVMNRRVIVEESGVRGITSGLDEHGFLLVRSEERGIQRVSSGGVRPDPGVLA